MLLKWLRIAAKKLLDSMDAAGILASALCLVGLMFGWKAYVAWRQGIGWHGIVAWYGKGNGSLQ